MERKTQTGHFTLPSLGAFLKALSLLCQSDRAPRKPQKNTYQCVVGNPGESKFAISPGGQQKVYQVDAHGVDAAHYEEAVNHHKSQLASHSGLKPFVSPLLIHGGLFQNCLAFTVSPQTAR
jgi:hypothetical protein